MTVHKRPRVVIVGAGFGGLCAARSLAHSEVDIWLIDRNNYHTFLPLLYQVAAAELEPGDIVHPIRSGLRKLPNVHFVLGEVNGIDFNARLVRTSATAIAYDFLIMALGSTPHFFGVPGAAEHALPLRTLAHGIAARNQILRCFERAVHEPDAQRRHALLTFAVVGGGPTVVEFAGSLAELIKGPLKKDYPSLDFGEVCVTLIEAADRLLPNLPERLARYTLTRLRKMTVDVRLRAPVSKITAGSVHLKDGVEIPTETVIWTAGVRGDPAAESWGLPTARSGQVTVRPTLQTPDHPDVYVIGDLAYVEQDGHPLPMVAPVAIQQGVMAAQNIGRQIAGQSPLPFHYRDRGSMVTIGRNAAVTDLNGRGFTGFIAWLLWLSVHIFNLIGFRNRLLVLVNWAWDYFFYERAVRLILPSETAPELQLGTAYAESRAERVDK